MSFWLEWCLLVFIVLNNVILSLFCGSLLTSQYKWLHAVLFAAAVPVSLIPLDITGISDSSACLPLCIAIPLCFMCCVTLLIFKDDTGKKLSVLFVGELLALLPQTFMYLPAVIYDFFSGSSVYTGLNGYFFAGQISICFSYAACCFFAAQWLKHRTSAVKSFRLMSCFIVIQGILFYIFGLKAHWSDSVGDAFEWFVLAFICVVSDLAAFCMLREMDKRVFLEEEKEFYETQLSMQLDLYQNFAAYTSGLQQVRQQLVRELAQVCTALDGGDYGRAFDGSSHLQEDLESLRVAGFCRNSLLNAVLFMKQREMDSLGISFQPVVRLEESTFVRRSDLCRIVSNLLDNAIEACASAAPPQSRLIRFTCMPVKHTLLIKTVNPFSGNRKPGRSGLPLSTKKEAGHGYGLSSVKEIVKSYDGVLNVDLDEEQGLASVSVTLFENTDFCCKIMDC